MLKGMNILGHGTHSSCCPLISCGFHASGQYYWALFFALSNHGSYIHLRGRVGLNMPHTVVEETLAISDGIVAVILLSSVSVRRPMSFRTCPLDSQLHGMEIQSFRYKLTTFSTCWMRLRARPSFWPWWKESCHLALNWIPWHQRDSGQAWNFAVCGFN